MKKTVTRSLSDYIEREILPRYEHFDDAHKVNHARMVIEQSLEIAESLDVKTDIVFTVAAYHDTGLKEGRELHHIFSGQIVRGDPRLREWFSEEEIEAIAQAAEDHRASASHPPRSIYGAIVADADRFIDPETIMRRTIQYGLAHEKELDKEGQYLRTSQHLKDKYGEGGYLKLNFPNSKNARRLNELRQIIADEGRLRELFERVCASLCC